MLNLFPSSGGEENSSPQDSGRKHKAARPVARLRPAFESLEDRLVPTKIFVHNLSDGPDLPINPVTHVAPNLRSAVLNSAPGDEIDLDTTAPGKPYVLSGAEGGELLISHNLTIKNKATAFSTIDASASNSRVFEIAGNVTATMTGLVITGGDGKGGGISGQGGGIYVNDNATLTLNRDYVTNNLATGTPARGGGIASYGLLTINNSVISRNSADGSTTTVGEPAEAQGGGIFTCYLCGGKLFLNTSTVSGNAAQGGFDSTLQQAYDGDGGGVFVNGGPTVQGNLAAVITNSTIADNFALGGSLNLQVQSITGAGEGGGLYQGSQTGFVTVTGSTFSGNQAIGGGGPLGVGGGSGRGGGVYQVAGAGNLTVTNSTFGGNLARGQGDAIGTGGGLYLAGGGTDTLTNDTVARNFAFAVRGGLLGQAVGIGTGGGLVTAGEVGANHARVLNTLIALNTAATDPDVLGDFVSLGHNLVGNPAGSTGFGAATRDLLNVSAASIGLGQLASNGGPTQTMALSSFSLAVDHGSDSVLSQLATDQTGRARKSGAHVDVGAFEFVRPVVVILVPATPGRRNGPLF